MAIERWVECCEQNKRSFSKLFDSVYYCNNTNYVRTAPFSNPEAAQINQIIKIQWKKEAGIEKQETNVF